MSKGSIGYFTTLLSGLLSIPVWITENFMQMGTLFFVGLSAVFGCIHYVKSWKLKDVERKIKLRQLDVDFIEFNPNLNEKKD